MTSQLEGQQIGRYLVRHELGGGGVATVYRAHDQVADRDVALKVLPPNPDAATLDRFRREALLAGALRHPHIVRILQVGTTEHTPAAYIAMDLVEGESLSALLARVGKLGAAESCRLLEPMARALDYAHGQGVIHRDVKPSNILLRPTATYGDAASPATSVDLAAYNSPVVPMLSDFGIARFLDAPELTGEGRTVGTPAYMAPEQCMGSREVDGRADVYALGAVLYRCVTGRLPFNGTSTQILHAHVFEPVVIDEEMARGLPPVVLEILRRALAKAPEARFQSAQALADALAAVGMTDAGGGSMALDATLTNAEVAPVVAMPRRTQQVLVPGSTEATQPVLSGRLSPGKKAARRGPSMERLVWALFFVLLIGGGGWWSASSWLRVRATREAGQSSLPALVFVTYTPSPRDDSTPMNQATAPAATMTPAMIALPASTITPLPTPADPTATPQPTLPPTWMPGAPTPAVPVPATPVPAGGGTGTPEADADLDRDEAMVGTCAMVVDEFFLASVGQLSGENARDFACPTSPARIVPAEWLPFERGVMVALAGDPLVYVYYEDGTWEQVARTDAGTDGAQSLPLPFGGVWAGEGRDVLLGQPMQTEPLRGETVMQPFVGGVALGNGGSGQVLFLARAKLPF